jgi:hypothetical protein
VTTATQVLDTARSQLGITETATNRTLYGQWYGLDGQAWCAMFVSWVFDQADLPIPAKQAKGFAYCPDGVNYFKRSNRWSNQPLVGDVVFYKFDQDQLADHVGIVESINIDGSIVAIEGNTNAAGSANGDSVMRRTRPRSLILGFGRPDYRQPQIQTQPQPQLQTLNNKTAKDEEVSNIASEFRYPNGTLTRLMKDGSIRNYGTPFFGSIHDVPASGKLNWTDGDGVLVPIDVNNASAGYKVYDEDANFIGEFTESWWKANGKR